MYQHLYNQKLSCSEFGCCLSGSKIYSIQWPKHWHHHQNYYEALPVSFYLKLTYQSHSFGGLPPVMKVFFLSLAEEFRNLFFYFHNIFSNVQQLLLQVEDRRWVDFIFYEFPRFWFLRCRSSFVFLSSCTFLLLTSDAIDYF